MRRSIRPFDDERKHEQRRSWCQSCPLRMCPLWTERKDEAPSALSRAIRTLTVHRIDLAFDAGMQSPAASKDLITATFVPGLSLAATTYREAVRPVLDASIPGLVHSAALLGSGSEVLGYDTV